MTVENYYKKKGDDFLQQHAAHRWISWECELQHQSHIMIWLFGRDRAGTQRIQGLVKVQSKWSNTVLHQAGKEDAKKELKTLEEQNEALRNSS